MLKQPEDYRNQINNVCLEFLWKEWGQLGIRGYPDGESEWISDPEALFLFTINLARYDSRLFDEVLDWFTLNARFMNVQRINDLIKEYTFKSESILPAFTSFLSNATRNQKWKKRKKKNNIGRSEPLFFLKDGRKMPVGNNLDPDFLNAGYKRSKVILKRNSGFFPPNKPMTLLFKLRSLFGINARCEILACLADGRQANQAEIFRLTDYSQKTIQNALAEMEYSGAIYVTRKSRIKIYQLKADEWNPLMKIKPGSNAWRPWAPLYAVIENILEKLKDMDTSPRTDLILSSEYRSIMDHVKPLLQKAQIPVTDDRNYRGKDYLKIFEKDIQSILDFLLPRTNTV